MRSGAAGIVLLAIVGACQSSAPPPSAPATQIALMASTHPVTLAVHGLPDVAASVEATGGRVRFDGTCVSLDFGAGHRSNLVWPKDFRAIAPPLAIIGRSGKPIIHEGDEVELGVAEGNAPVDGCPTRGTLLVGEVSSVNGVAWPDGAPAPPPVSKPGPR